MAFDADAFCNDDGCRSAGLGPTRMSMVTYILPLVRVLLGTVFLEERFHWGAIIGGLLILLGFIVVNKTPAPQK